MRHHRGLFALMLVTAVLTACGDGRSESERAATTATPAGTARTSVAPSVRGTPASTLREPLPTPGPNAELAVVTRVVDGDTIDVRLRDGRIARVRYIGVNTPESVDPRRPVECFGREAARANARLVEDQEVLLERDISETDQYDRLLRYVWAGGELVNAVLVRDGYARTVTYPPDVKYRQLLNELERQAIRAGRGLWRGCRG